MLFAVIGWGIRGRSASPAMHRASFSRLGLDAEYVALDVPRHGLECFVSLARFNMRGFNVTMPHKEEVMRHLDTVAAEARAVGAVNTVLIDRGLAVGHNTDAQAVYRLAGGDMRGADVLVLGAGGAARAAVYAAVKAEAKAVYVANRTEERARELARDFRERFGRHVEAVPWGAMPRAEVVVNATPVGDRVLADLSRAHMYVEFVYVPPETAMVRAAREAGVRVVDGLDILVEQGALAEEIWLGVNPDRSAMREAAESFIRRLGAGGT